MSDTHLDETRLHDAADGSLAGADVDAVEAHLAGCAACAERVRSIRALLEDARALAAPVEPERDLWPGIRARLGGRGKEIPFPARVRVDGEAASRRPATSRHSGAWPAGLRVAASVALLVVGGAAGMLIARAGQAPVAPVATEPPDGAAPGDAAALASDVIDVRATLTGEYANPVAELEAELERRRNEMPPETVAEIERNLEIVDRAIDAALAAFDESPGDPVLPDMLHSAYGRKVKLLERAVGLPRAI